MFASTPVSACADGWHDWLRGVEGAEQAAVRAFELCHEHGFPTGAQIVLHRESASVLPETIRMLGELGVTSVLVDAVEGEGDARGMGELLLSYDEFFDLCCDQLQQLLENGTPMPHINLGGIFDIVQGVARLSRGHTDVGDACASKPACTTIRSSMYVSPDGYILPCIPFSYDDAQKKRFPDLDTMSIAEALTDSSYSRLISSTAGDVFEHDSVCQACEYRGFCRGGCRAKGVDESGGKDPLGHDPDACRFFLGGYYDRARKLVESLTSSS